MNQTLRKTAFPFLSAALLMYGCNKSNLKSTPSGQTETSVVHHKYGLTPVSDDEMKNVPVFSPALLRSGASDLGLTYSGTLPSSYLLVTPSVRDQGQIGSCTGFCGSEANEILEYYKSVNPTSVTGITSTSAAISAINSNKFASPTSYFGSSGALAPLFLYYVERVLIQKQRITVDNGANMVNIGQALQGLTNNTGTGAALTKNGVTYKGECTENLYAYPSTLDASGYNVATSSSTQYRTAPSSAAIANAPSFSLATQSGSTTSSGTTTAHGYYYIAGTGDATEVTNVKTAIANNKPVLMGFTVYDNSNYTVFEGLNTTSYIYNPLTNGKITSGLSALGGHAVPLVGYFDDGTAATSATGGGYFIVQNSWGTPWGYNGHFLLPYSVLKNSSVVGNNNLYVMLL
ncbi:MAG TPA: C1 family peptidase [Puia sp.]|nr:C1 family peptidase [Puia sp.]